MSRYQIIFFLLLFLFACGDKTSSNASQHNSTNTRNSSSRSPIEEQDTTPPIITSGVSSSSTIDKQDTTPPIITSGVSSSSTIDKQDTTPPIITLIGGERIIVEYDKANTISAKAHDDVDGDISMQIIENKTTDAEGNTIVSYDVTDSAGNKAKTKYRTWINQTDSESEEPTTPNLSEKKKSPTTPPDAPDLTSNNRVLTKSQHNPQDITTRLVSSHDANKSTPTVTGMLKRVVDTKGRPFIINNDISDNCGIKKPNVHVVSGNGQQLMICTYSSTSTINHGKPRLTFLTLDKEYVVQKAIYLKESKIIEYAAMNEAGTRVLVRIKQDIMYFNPQNGQRISTHRKTNCSNFFDPSLKYCIVNVRNQPNIYQVWDIKKQSLVKTVDLRGSSREAIKLIALDKKLNVWYSNESDDHQAGDNNRARSVFSTGENYSVLRSFDKNKKTLKCDTSYERFQAGTLIHKCKTTNLYHVSQPELNRWNRFSANLTLIGAISPNGKFVFFYGQSNQAPKSNSLADVGLYLLNAETGKIVAGPAKSHQIIFDLQDGGQPTNDGVVFFNTEQPLHEEDNNHIRELYIWDYRMTPKVMDPVPMSEASLENGGDGPPIRNSSAPSDQNKTDTTPPVITLKGELNSTVLEPYTLKEPGYTAFDNTDGDLSKQVQVKVHFKAGYEYQAYSYKPYTHVLTYDVTDKAGNKAETKTRTITVRRQKPIVSGLLKRVVDSKGQSIRVDQSFDKCNKLNHWNKKETLTGSRDGKYLIVCALFTNPDNKEHEGRLTLLSLNDDYVIQKQTYLDEEMVDFFTFDNTGTTILLKYKQSIAYYNPQKNKKIETITKTQCETTFNSSLSHCLVEDRQDKHLFYVHDVKKNQPVKTIDLRDKVSDYFPQLFLDNNLNVWYSSQLDDPKAGDTNLASSIFSTDGEKATLRSYDTNQKPFKCNTKYWDFQAGTLLYECRDSNTHYTSQPEAKRWHRIQGYFGVFAGVSPNGRFLLFEGESIGTYVPKDPSDFGHNGLFIVDAYTGSIVAGPAKSQQADHSVYNGHITNQATVFFSTTAQVDHRDDNNLEELYVWDFQGKQNMTSAAVPSTVVIPQSQKQTFTRLDADAPPIGKTQLNHPQPTIQLKGKTNMVLTEGDTFSEPGIAVYDHNGREITDDIIVQHHFTHPYYITTRLLSEGSIKQQKAIQHDGTQRLQLGTYTVLYHVHDKAHDQTVQEYRTIKVVKQRPVVSGLLKRVQDRNGKTIRIHDDSGDDCGIQTHSSSVVSGNGKHLIVCTYSATFKINKGVSRLAFLTLNDQYNVEKAFYLDKEKIDYAAINEAGTRVLVQVDNEITYYNPQTGKKIAAYQNIPCSNVFDPSFNYCIVKNKSTSDVYQVYNIQKQRIEKTLNFGSVSRQHIYKIYLDKNLNAWYGSHKDIPEADDNNQLYSILSTSTEGPILRSYDKQGSPLSDKISSWWFHGDTLVYGSGTGFDHVPYINQPKLNKTYALKFLLGEIIGISPNGHYMAWKGTTRNVNLKDTTDHGNEGIYLVDTQTGEIVAGPAKSQDLIYDSITSGRQPTNTGVVFFHTIYQLNEADDNFLRELYVWDYQKTSE